IDHVRVVRIHSRVPIADPERIDAGVVAALRAEGVATWLAVHANHPRELTAKVRAVIARVVDAGIPVVSQSVLLRGVNDDAATLEALMRAFVECRVKPYYLHQGDLAPGTSHLRTTIAEGQALMRQLRGRVSGLCQPDYVLDIPGGHGKAPIGPTYLADGGRGEGRGVIASPCIAVRYIAMRRRPTEQRTGQARAPVTLCSSRAGILPRRLGRKRTRRPERTCKACGGATCASWSLQPWPSRQDFPSRGRSRGRPRLFCPERVRRRQAALRAAVPAPHLSGIASRAVPTFRTCRRRSRPSALRKIVRSIARSKASVAAARLAGRR